MAIESHEEINQILFYRIFEKFVEVIGETIRPGLLLFGDWLMSETISANENSSERALKSAGLYKSLS